MSPHLVYAENQILLGRFSLQLSRSPSPVDGSVFARVLATSRLNGYVLKFVFVFKSEPHSKLVFVHFPLELLIAFFCHLPCFLSLFTFFFFFGVSICVYMYVQVHMYVQEWKLGKRLEGRLPPLRHVFYWPEALVS